MRSRTTQTLLALACAASVVFANDDKTEEWIRQIRGDETKEAFQEIMETWPPPKEVLSATLEVFRKNKLRRDEAGEVLTWIGEPAIPGLIESLRNSATNYEAGLALARLGEASIQPLLDAFAAGTVDESALAYLLSGLGPLARSAVPALERYATVNDSFCFDDALSRIAPPSKRMLRLAVEDLRDPSFVDAAILIRLGDAGQSLTPAFKAALKDAEPTQVPGIALAAWRAGMPIEEAVGHIMRSLENEQGRSNALRALAAMGPAAVNTSATDGLLDRFEREPSGDLIGTIFEIGCRKDQLARARLLAESKNSRKREVAAAIAISAETSPAALELVMKLAQDPENKVRGWARAGLLSMSVDTPGLADALAPLLDGNDLQEVGEVWIRLSACGRSDRVVPRILKEIGRRDIIHQWRAIRVAGQWNVKEAAPLIRKHVRSLDHDIRQHAILALAYMRDEWIGKPPYENEHAPSDSDVALAAGRVLRGERVEESLAVLRRALRALKTQESVLNWISHALRDKAKALLPDIARFRHHPGDFVWAEGAFAYSRAGGDPDFAMRWLVHVIAHDSARSGAIYLLSEHGAAARPYLRFLRQISCDPDAVMAVRTEARRAIRRITAPKK